MADGGSSGGWSPLEIIIVLILILALLGRLFGMGTGNVKVPDVATYKPDQKSEVQSFNECGKILVTRPKPLEKISLTAEGVTVHASVTTCNTIFVAPDSFTITVVNGAGLPLTPVVEVPVAASRDLWQINAFIPFSTPPTPGTGYVIVGRTSNTGSPVAKESARIPIRFVNQ